MRLRPLHEEHSVTALARQCTPRRVPSHAALLWYDATTSTVGAMLFYPTPRICLALVAATTLAVVSDAAAGAPQAPSSTKPKPARGKTAPAPQPSKPASKPAEPAPPPPPPPPPVRSWEEVDREIAARFAPIFYEGMIGTGRFDYITNFDFDGDWVGDNNWSHAADTKFPLRAYIYYAVSETPTHYFVHYAVFHPRDWKGGSKSGRVLSGTIRETTTVGGTVKPRGLADNLVLAHENDLEGCVVAVAKNGASLDAARVVFVETVAHNRYLRYAPEGSGFKDADPLRLDGQHPLLYVEPAGHGISAFHDQSVRAATAADAAAGETAVTPEDEQEAEKEEKKGGGLFGKVKKVKDVTKVKGLVTNQIQDFEVKPTKIVVFRYTGTAGNPDATPSGAVGYDLKALYDTLWKTASTGPNPTFGEAQDYGTRTIHVASAAAEGAETERQVKLGTLGSALRGVAGAPNKARPPWGWFDMGERDRPLGEWFFDPAATLLRHLGGAANWRTAYIHEPFLGVLRGRSASVPSVSASSTTGAANTDSFVFRT